MTQLETLQAQLAMLQAQDAENEARYARELLSVPFQYNQRKASIAGQIVAVQAQIAELGG